MPTPESEPVRPQRLPAAEGVTGPATATGPGAAAQPLRAPADRKRQPSGDEARGRAMRAAISAIAEKGTAAVRMSDIAARAGMSTGHILYHFGRKDRLLLEVLAWSEADLGARFQQAADEAASPAEKLALFVRFYLPRHQGDERYALWTQVLAQRHDDSRPAPAHRAVRRLGGAPGSHPPGGTGPGAVRRCGPFRVRHQGRGHAQRALRRRDVRTLALAERLRALVRPVRPRTRTAADRPGLTTRPGPGSRPTR